VAHGRSLRRIFAGRAGRRKVELFEPRGVKTVLFVFDEPHAGTRYRSRHQAEQLGFLGVSFDVVQSDRIDLAAAVDNYACFVLNRVEWSDEIAAFVERARARGKRVIFDTDDLIFEPELGHHFAFLEGWPEQGRRSEIEKLDRFRRTLEACGGATVSTEPLKHYAGKRTEPVEVVFNSVSEEMVRLADEALAGSADSPSGSEVTIAYLSGTRTHNRDFLEAAAAVLWALETYPQARFVVIGKLDLDDRFARLGPRVTRVALQPWRALPALLSEIDINLAPLEPNNPVTECKSCVKYLEAGLLSVPTVASPNPDFVRATQGGRTGLLATGSAEWREALGGLIESSSLRREIGSLARADVLENHTTRARAPLLDRTLAALGVPTATSS
jgi:glycosyltransferase involved in cell wall biosynthesis